MRAGRWTRLRKTHEEVEGAAELVELGKEELDDLWKVREGTFKSGCLDPE